MTPHRMFALLPLLGLGLAACGGGKGDHSRVAFVEVTSVPSGLPVQIDLNGAIFQATTPVSRNVSYDPTCVSPPFVAVPTCSLLGQASLKVDNPSGKQVAMCLTDAGKRRCDSRSDIGFVFVSLDFENS